MEFVAIDFETANKHYNSACELGVTVVEDGRISTTFSHLIKPWPHQFNKHHVAIHGIDAYMVYSAPRFDQVWKEIADLIEDNIVVAHNISFDIRVLRAMLKDAKVPIPKMRTLCSVQIARKTWPEFPSHSLGSLCRSLMLPLTHHRAASDALACACVIIEAAKKYDVESVEDLCRIHNVKLSEVQHQVARPGRKTGY